MKAFIQRDQNQEYFTAVLRDINLSLITVPPFGASISSVIGTPTYNLAKVLVPTLSPTLSPSTTHIHLQRKL